MNAVLSIGFEWGIGTQSIDFEKIVKPGPERDFTLQQMREWSTKVGRQATKDYVAFPALTSLSPAATYRSTLKANVVANVLRNIWAHAVIFCGHFPDGAEKFTKTDMVGESKGEWYLRQMLGSANFEGGPALRFMSGNLCHQIEHHLFPDLPSNRLHETSVRVREVCDQVRLALHDRLFPEAVRPRHGAPSPNCRCRISTCATPPTTLRRRAASGCSSNYGPATAGPIR